MKQLRAALPGADDADTHAVVGAQHTPDEASVDARPAGHGADKFAAGIHGYCLLPARAPRFLDLRAVPPRVARDDDQELDAVHRSEARMLARPGNKVRHSDLRRTECCVCVRR